MAHTDCNIVVMIYILKEIPPNYYSVLLCVLITGNVCPPVDTLSHSPTIDDRKNILARLVDKGKKSETKAKSNMFYELTKQYVVSLWKGKLVKDLYWNWRPYLSITTHFRSYLDTPTPISAHRSFCP